MQKPLRKISTVVQFVLLLVCKRTNGESFKRSSLLNAVDTAIELYINDEQIYQNMVASRKINKEFLLKIRKRDDFIDLIINNISFVDELYSKPYERNQTYQNL